jgi:hypothetical protein
MNWQGIEYAWIYVSFLTEFLGRFFSEKFVDVKEYFWRSLLSLPTAIE